MSPEELNDAILTHQYYELLERVTDMPRLPVREPSAWSAQEVADAEKILSVLNRMRPGIMPIFAPANPEANSEGYVQFPNLFLGDK